MKRIFNILLRFLDFFLLFFVFLSAITLKVIRIIGVNKLPLSKDTLIKVGVFPIRNHYYEPKFDFRANPITRPLIKLSWNEDEQLQLLGKFNFTQELATVPNFKPKENTPQFYLYNGAFECGDAEFWYQLIRLMKPNTIIEIGSGHSTLMASKAIYKNKELNQNYYCEHICIEPFEMPWLENIGVQIIREKVENIPLKFFSKLKHNDILFIDSSHIIRPGGDVLFEYLELLPSLNKGVIVHIHDIFTPNDYPKRWLVEEVKFWNEQYLLEAFLMNNPQWKILGALNFLKHKYFEDLVRIAPGLTRETEPASFYIQKI